MESTPRRSVDSTLAWYAGITLVLLAAVATLTLMLTPPAQAAEPNLYDGRVHIIVGKPTAAPGASPRRVYPANANAPRGVTLLRSRSSLPHTWEAWELPIVASWAQRRGWRTWTTHRGGFDLTPNLTGKEWRVDRRILTAANATARTAGGTCYVISGWRDSSLQTKLYQLFLAGLGNPANPPGTSKHEAPARMPSRAADVYCGSGTTFWAWARHRRVAGFAGSRGLREPYSHEPWHVEYAAVAR